MVSSVSFHVSPILLHKQSTEQSKTGESNHDLDKSSSASTAMVHWSSRNVCRESSPFTNHPKTSSRSSGKPWSTGGKELLVTTGLESLRKKNWLGRKCKRKLQNLSLMLERKADFLITNWPGESRLVGVVNKKLIRINAL